ncbi:MAG: biopolymer transporter ExbD [Pirellulaceae bacterium]
MKFRHTTSSGDDKIELQMTPMIDIVFQLLVFFIMTFKIVAQEGDFNIRMPLASEGGAPDESQMPPYKLYLTANQDGTLEVPFLMDGLTFDNFKSLQEHLILEMEDPNGVGPEKFQEEAEVELHCDYGLRYDFVIQAIDSVRGKLDRATGQTIEIVQKIKFAPPPDRSGQLFE